MGMKLFGNAFEVAVGEQVGLKNKYAHETFPILRQGVGCPLTIVESVHDEVKQPEATWALCEPTARPGRSMRIKLAHFAGVSRAFLTFLAAVY